MPSWHPSSLQDYRRKKASYEEKELRCEDAFEPISEEVNMDLKAFLIIACPFPLSDLTSEYTEYGMDEEDALKQFRERYPAFRVKEIREK